MEEVFDKQDVDALVEFGRNVREQCPELARAVHVQKAINMARVFRVSWNNGGQYEGERGWEYPDYMSARKCFEEESKRWKNCRMEACVVVYQQEETASEN